MKNPTIYFSVLLMFHCCSIYAQSETNGIHFYQGNWKSLLAESNRQDKLIFVDVYTDWCGPCKQMEAQIFPQQEVGDTYNQLFINYRLNAEKGEGPALADKYAIKSYPTWLYLDASGNVVARDGDYKSASSFIALARQANKQKNASGNLADLEGRFLRGDRQPEFLKSYLLQRTSLKLDNTELLQAYLSAVPPEQFRKSEEILFLSRNMGSKYSKAVPLLLANMDVLADTQKREVAERLYSSLLYYDLGKAIKDNRPKDAANTLVYIQQVLPFLPEKHLSSINNLKLHYYTVTKDAPQLKLLANPIAKKLMAIPADSIEAENKERYVRVMEPFISGKQDSTKIPGFADERKLAEKQYSAELASQLYTMAAAYRDVLDTSDADLNDALLWAEKAHALMPNKNTALLVTEIRSRIRK